MRKMILITIFIVFSLSVFAAKFVTESFFEMDLKQALSQISYDTGETIITDDTVGGYVTMELKDVTIEKALDLLLLPGGYSWARIGSIYFVSLATPDSDKFMYFTNTIEYKSKNYRSSDLLSLLPEYMRKYVNTSGGDPYVITVTAPKQISDRVLNLLRGLDRDRHRLTLEVLVIEVSDSLFKRWERDWSYSSSPSGTTTFLSISGDWFNMNISNILGSLSGSFNLNKSSENIKVLSESTVQTVNGAQTNTYSKTTRVYQYVQNGTTNYVSIDVGVETNILPLMMGNKIVLNIVQNLFSAENTGSTVPSNVKQGIQTSIVMDLNSRIAVASLGFKTLNEVESKIPVLGDIPIIGNLFTQMVYGEVQKHVVLFVSVKDGDQQ